MTGIAWWVSLRGRPASRPALRKTRVLISGTVSPSASAPYDLPSRPWGKASNHPQRRARDRGRAPRRKPRRARGHARKHGRSSGPPGCQRGPCHSRRSIASGRDDCPDRTIPTRSRVLTSRTLSSRTLEPSSRSAEVYCPTSNVRSGGPPPTAGVWKGASIRLAPSRVRFISVTTPRMAANSGNDSLSVPLSSAKVC